MTFSSIFLFSSKDRAKEEPVDTSGQVTRHNTPYRDSCICVLVCSGCGVSVEKSNRASDAVGHLDLPESIRFFLPFVSFDGSCKADSSDRLFFEETDCSTYLHRRLGPSRALSTTGVLSPDVSPCFSQSVACPLDRTPGSSCPVVSFCFPLSWSRLVSSGAKTAWCVVLCPAPVAQSSRSFPLVGSLFLLLAASSEVRWAPSSTAPFKLAPRLPCHLSHLLASEGPDLLAREPLNIDRVQEDLCRLTNHGSYSSLPESSLNLFWSFEDTRDTLTEMQLTAKSRSFVTELLTKEIGERGDGRVSARIRVRWTPGRRTK